MKKENIIKLTDTISNGETFVIIKRGEDLDFSGFADSKVDDETIMKRVELLEKSSTTELESFNDSENGEEFMKINMDFISSEKKETSLSEVKDSIENLKDGEFIVFKKENDAILIKK